MSSKKNQKKLLGLTTTTGAPDADTAAVGSGDLVIDLF
jgi:hypothetical protein